MGATALTHVAITYDPQGTVSIFVNGKRTPATAAPFRTVGNASGDLRIGGSSREAGQGLCCLIDEIRISRGIVYPKDSRGP